MGNAIYRWTLDDATLSSAEIKTAGAGLPRRIVALAGRPAAILADNPSGFWRMDDAGATLVDSSGNALDGTINSATLVTGQQVGGQYSDYLVSNGGNPMAEVPSNALLEPAYNEPWTVEFWLTGSQLFTVGTSGFLVGQGGYRAPVYWPGWHVFWYFGNFYVVLHDGNNFVKQYRIDFTGYNWTTVWNHIVVTYNGDHNAFSAPFRYYINNAGPYNFSGYDADQAIGAIAYANDPCIFLKDRDFTNMTGVALDNVAFFKGVILTPTQVSNHYNGTAGTAQARWTYYFDTATTIKGTMVPGALSQQGTTLDTQVYLSTDGGNTRQEVLQGTDPDYPIAQGDTLTFDVDFNSGGSGYVGSDGPAVVYDVADAVSITLDAVKSPVATSQVINLP